MRTHLRGIDRSGAARRAPSGLVQVFVVAGALVAYQALRVVVEGTPAEAHANTESLLALERTMGIDWERSVQQWVLDDPSAVTFWNFVYKWLYWPSVGGALTLLWWRDRSRYFLLRNALVIAAGMGLLIFAVFPVAPPRFLDGFVDTLAVRGERSLGADSPWANAYAAMPSFHVGWPALAGAVVAQSCRSTGRAVLALVPAALIAVAVVVTANHFFLDVAGGLLVVAAAHRLAVAADDAPGSVRTGVGRSTASASNPAPAARTLPATSGR